MVRSDPSTIGQYRTRAQNSGIAGAKASHILHQAVGTIPAVDERAKLGECHGDASD